MLPARRPAGGLHLRPAATAGLLVAAAIAAMSVVPADVWAMLLGVVLPLAMMLLFTVGPIAIPVLAFVLIARAVSGPPVARRRRA
jgi:hypothetical protein